MKITRKELRYFSGSTFIFLATILVLLNYASMSHVLMREEKLISDMIDKKSAAIIKDLQDKNKALRAEVDIVQKELEDSKEIPRILQDSAAENDDADNSSKIINHLRKETKTVRKELEASVTKNNAADNGSEIFKNLRRDIEIDKKKDDEKQQKQTQKKGLKEEENEEEQQNGENRQQKFEKEQQKLSKDKEAVTTSTDSPTAKSISISPPKSNATATFIATKVKEEETLWTLRDQEDYAESIKPWTNLTTFSFDGNFFYAGYRNQMMAFSALIIDIQQQYPNGGAQILLNTIRHKDLFGTNKKIPHELIFDVKHWNSFYPNLPRLVSCDSKIHFDYNCNKNDWTWGITNRTAVYASTSPKTWGKKQPGLFTAYQRLQQMQGRLWNNLGAPKQTPNPTDFLMMKHALRLHPELNALVQKARQSIVGKDSGSSRKTNSINRRVKKSNEIDVINNNSHGGGDINDYIALHARIEPDMIDHNTPCKFKRLSNLTKIFQLMESQFIKNPPSNVIVLTNMKLLQPDALAKLKNPDTQILATENANVLNSALENGLWNGTVKVTQIGNTPILNVPHYERYKVTIGASIDFDLALNAKYFIGTEVSSYSLDILRSRFFRGHSNGNFYYHPRGLMQWTNETTTPKTLPTFEC